MSDAVAELLGYLDLEKIEHNIFRGDSPKVGWQRVFGGLVIAQALVAAARTVPDRPPHSLHGYFILPGDPSVPIVYEVDRIRDGASFTTRRCNAIQHGRAIFSLAASFQIEEVGLEHQVDAPAAPAPETLANETELFAAHKADAPDHVRRWMERERPIELRPVEPARFASNRAAGLSPHQQVWVRAVRRLPDDPAIHRAVLAYLSDMTLLDTALIVHGKSFLNKDMQVASLDHSLWFHRPFRADEWLLYTQDSPSSSGARGMTRGSIYSRDGALVASVAQEGLMRVRAPRL